MNINFCVLNKKGFRFFVLIMALSLAVVITASFFLLYQENSVQVSTTNSEKAFIRWVSFNVSYSALKKALDYDINSYGTQKHLDWIEILSIAACFNGGSFSDKDTSIIDKVAQKLNDGKGVEQITDNSKYYSYYKESYEAVLGGFVGEFEQEVYDENSEEKKKVVKRYGLKVFSPVAYGYGYSHSKDFGNSRSYGFTRRHLGNDLVGSVGSPLVAVEDGTIENIGWNRYGGWRIGIRSHDTKRYYYYAHLRKSHPFVNDLKEGMEVKAGDVIGYLGMTGYSTTEDYNGMKTPHLHFGIQLVFDESQIDSVNEIWIDVYNIVKLLRNTRSAVIKNEQTGDFERLYKRIK